MSWGNPRAWPLPEIYLTDGANARQWENVSVYAYYKDVPYGSLKWIGEMTQQGACQQPQRGCSVDEANSPYDGWYQLQEAVDSDPGTAGAQVEYETDIFWFDPQ